MKYYLYHTDALWNIRSLQEEFDIPNFVTPYETVKNTLSDRAWKRAYFEANYDEETGDLCVVMAIHDDICDPLQLSYYRLSKRRMSIPLDLWEITLMGDVRRDGDPINIQFSVGPDDDTMDEAIFALSKKICESTSKISAVSSFKKGWLYNDEDSDMLIIFEFRSQFDGHIFEQKDIVNVYEVKKV